MPLSPIPIIVLAELFGASLWFSANAAAPDLARDWGASVADIGFLTNAVQLGFILGALGFSLSGIADRFSASRIFAASAMLGALFNAGFALLASDIPTAAVYRFGVGLCLAGIYPLGMKLIVGWAPERAGTVLAHLVGMLTLGTALPHATRAIGAAWPWQAAILASSLLALVAATMILKLGDGPHFKRSANAPRIRPGQSFAAFRIPAFRASAFGYFGHMWELYAFWTLVPVLVAAAGADSALGVGNAWLSFAIIGIGAAGCVLGGRLSRLFGSARVAAVALAISGACCIAFPLVSGAAPLLVLAFLLVWGTAVIADSPQFSALSANACPPDLMGGALAIQNAIGFAITLAAIALGTAVFDSLGTRVAWLLVPGPILGLIGLAPLLRTRGKH